jgi:large subunit ribosomal protein L31e
MAEENKATEQIYTIPLREVKDYPVWKRSNKAIKIIREYLSKHMKVDEDKIKISSELNEAVWEHGIEKPPSTVRVKAVRSEEGVTAQVVGSE